FFQAEDGIRDFHVTGVQTCALPISQLQTGVERIGTAFHLPGTHARISAGRNALAALEVAALAELRTLADAGFDNMAAQVDPFLRSEERRVGKECLSAL